MVRSEAPLAHSSVAPPFAQVKAGQYLSSRADVLPEAYISRLKLLQDALPPRPLEEIVETVEQELGGKVQDLFTSFDETPLATASIAQVIGYDVLQDFF